MSKDARPTPSRSSWNRGGRSLDRSRKNDQVDLYVDHVAAVPQAVEDGGGEHVGAEHMGRCRPRL
jgi:hypothetical protein